MSSILNRPRRSHLFAGLMLLAAASVGGQVPVKRPSKDTTVKQQGVPKKTVIPRVQKSGGEIALPPIVKPTIPPCEEIIPVCGVDPSRDAAIRADQHKLDSILASLREAQLTSDMQYQVATARREVRDQIERAARLKEESDAAALRLRMETRGRYLGLAGGASTPLRDVRDGYTGGYNVTVPVGFDVSDSPLGIRADATVDHLNGTRIHDQFGITTAASGDITVWSLNLDLKARMMAPGLTRSHLYALGGIGAHRVTGGVYGTTGTAAGNDLTFGNAGTKFGWNMGAGAAFAWGPAELFVESRFVQVKTDYDYRLNGGLGRYTSFTPVVVGLQWF